MPDFRSTLGCTCDKVERCAELNTDRYTESAIVIVDPTFTFGLTESNKQDVCLGVANPGVLVRLFFVAELTKWRRLDPSDLESRIEFNELICTAVCDTWFTAKKVDPKTTVAGCLGKPINHLTSSHAFAQWGIRKTASPNDRLIIAEDQRYAEYYPQKMLPLMPEDVRREYVDKAQNGQPQADAYLRFVVEELKPAIDRRYATRSGAESSFVLGSSMGGLISAYALCE